MTTVWAGLSVGAIYALVALGYNIVYWGLTQLGWPIVPILVVAVVIVALAAVTEERVAIRPVREIQGQLVTMVGSATLITGIIEIIWGQQALTVPSFFSNTPTHVLGGAVVPDDLVLIGLAVAGAVGFALVSRFTMIGLSALAVSEDREAAQMRGVRVRRIQLGVFAISGVLAGLLGPFIGPLTFASYTLPYSLALIGFVALALGGYGSIIGATLGAFALGLVEQYTDRYIGGNYENLMVFAILIIVLMIVPNGVFGARRERMV
jgi:branched-chain amino acid transport system permease protein